MNLGEALDLIALNGMVQGKKMDRICYESINLVLDTLLADHDGDKVYVLAQIISEIMKDANEREDGFVASER